MVNKERVQTRIVWHRVWLDAAASKVAIVLDDELVSDTARLVSYIHHGIVEAYNTL